MSEEDIYDTLHKNDAERITQLHTEGKLDFSKNDDKKGRLKILGYCVSHPGLEVSLAVLLRILTKEYDEKTRTEILNEKNEAGIFKTYAPIHLAVAYGNIEALKLLLDRPEVDVQAKTVDKQNALHCILEACHRVDTSASIPILHLLLGKGVDVKAKMIRKRTVPMIYASKEASELLFSLFDHFKSNTKILNKLLNEQDEFGDTVLHHACKSQIQRLFKYKFNEYASNTYETIYVICLFDVDVTIQNIEEDLALDIIYFQFADLMDFVHEHRSFFAQHFPTLQSLLTAPIDSRFTEHFDLVALDKFKHYCSSWLAELEAQAEAENGRGACPVLNTSASEPIKSRRWLKITENASSSSSNSSVSSDGEDEEVVELPKSRKSSAKDLNKDLEKFTTGKCPFGFTSESGVPNPHLQQISAPPPVVENKKEIPTKIETIDKPPQFHPVAAQPNSIKSVLPSSIPPQDQVKQITKSKAKTFVDEIKLEFHTLRFWFYAFFWLLSIWITKEICTWSC